MMQELQEKKAGLVLEGGASRGVFTAGILDYLLDRDVLFPYVVGVSAGACNALSYVSKQRGRSFDCLAPEGKENQYKFSLREAIMHGSLYDMDKLFETFPRETFPYDFKTYTELNIDCEMVVTNVLTGEAEYMMEKKNENLLCKICRASSSLPLASPMVSIRGVPYLDGGLADSIPLKRALETGHKKNVVVLTRPYGYRKKFPDESLRMFIPLYKNYPNLMKAIYYRGFYYNKRIEAIEKLEKEGKVFVIRPSIKCPKKTDTHRSHLQEFYTHGYDVMASRMNEMMEFLGVSI
ncbi:MAG: patatin family protein [Lachnospiraceae bacterium]